MTGLHKAPVDELGRTGKDDKAPDSLGKAVDIADDMLDDDALACVALPAATLIIDGAEPRAGALDFTGETTAGTQPGLGGAETKGDVHTEGNVKLPA